MKIDHSTIDDAKIDELQDGLTIFASQYQYALDCHVARAADGTDYYICEEYKRKDDAEIADVFNFSNFAESETRILFSDYASTSVQAFTTIAERDACILTFITTRNHF